MKIKKKTILLLAIAIISISVIVSFFIILSRNPGTDCSSYSVDYCPNECVVCPPCEVCSSIACMTEEHCSSIGFNRTWHEDIKQRLNTPDGN
jgi:hypothetical protein